MERISEEVGIQEYHSNDDDKCFDLFVHTSIIELMNFRNLVCTAFLVNVVWFTSVRLAEISHYVLKNIGLIARKRNSKNQPGLNTRGLMTIA